MGSKIQMTYVRVANALKGDEGAGLAEYALLLFLIAVAAIATLGPLGDTIAGVFSDIDGELGGAGGGGGGGG